MPDVIRPARSRARNIVRVAVATLVGAVAGAVTSITLAVGPLASTELPESERVPANPLTTIPDDPTVLIVGDSWAEGIGATKPDLGWARAAAEALSWNATIDAVGGTGFTKGNASDGRTDLAYDQRISAHAASGTEYDIIVFQGGLNDFLAPPREETVAVIRAVDIARQRWPEAAIVVFGPLEPLAQGVDRSSRLEAIATGAEESDAIYVDPKSPVPWLNERNSPRFDAGDGLHLNDAGYAYVAARFAATIESYTD
ncbi:SGNH/GDSL hydrolase family protein [Agromyces tropicus]|uniref:SGNH/GDSL hydrolase family protein n=1 Tax=Agromyces tropicus TaxID=555371 RepID=UPI0031DB4195